MCEESVFNSVWVVPSTPATEGVWFQENQTQDDGWSGTKTSWFSGEVILNEPSKSFQDWFWLLWILIIDYGLKHLRTTLTWLLRRNNESSRTSAYVTVFLPSKQNKSILFFGFPGVIVSVICSWSCVTELVPVNAYDRKSCWRPCWRCVAQGHASSTSIQTERIHHVCWVRFIRNL